MPLCLRIALRCLAVPYELVVRVRNALFDLQWRRQTSVDVPVIAVGNLTTGGTGKTPVVAWIVQCIQKAERKPGIVSRGYGADSTGTNDEKRVLEISCPNVPHEQNPDRVHAANQIIQQNNVDAIVLDDAFQHRKISRDLNLVLIDATNPFGYGYVLPRGLLREPISGLQRADVVFITRADNVSDDSLKQIESRILKAKNDLRNRIHRISFRPTSIVTKDGRCGHCNEIRGKRVTVMTGIGNPDAFVATCTKLGAVVVATKFFPDHHHFTSRELNAVEKLADDSDCSLILCTVKDLVKIPAERDRIQAVQIETVFEDPAQADSARDIILESIAQHAK